MSVCIRLAKACPKLYKIPGEVCGHCSGISSVKNSLKSFKLLSKSFYVNRHLASLRTALIFNVFVFFSLCNYSLHANSGCLALSGVKPIKKYSSLYRVFVFGYMFNCQVHIKNHLLLLCLSVTRIYLRNNSFQASVSFL